MSEIQTLISCTPNPVDDASRISNDTKTLYRLAAEQAFQELTGTSGFSAIPNLLLDKMRGVLERNEYDVFMYIIRRTLAFHKLSDAISMSQFQNGIVTQDGRRLDYGCGIKGAATIARALKQLEALGFIVREQKLAANGAFATNTYTLCPAAIVAKLETQISEQLTDRVEDKPGWGMVTELQVTEAAENNRPTICIKTTTIDNNQASSGSAITEVPHQAGKGYTKNKEGLHLAGVDKKRVQQNKNQKKEPCMGQLSLVNGDGVATLERVKTDAVLLRQLGFDQTTALNLAITAQQKGKPEDYISTIIAYSLKTASRNPAGLARRLIERGEERTAKYAQSKKPTYTNFAAKTTPAKTTKFANLANTYQPFQQTDASKAAITDLDGTWQKVCQVVAGKLAQPDLADLLAKMQLEEIEKQHDKLVCRVKSEQTWQMRLITPAAVALIKLGFAQVSQHNCELVFC